MSRSLQSAASSVDRLRARLVAAYDDRKSFIDTDEIGVKGELSAGRTTMHAALFRIDDEDRALADPDNPTCSVNAGKVRSAGFEADLVAQPERREPVQQEVLHAHGGLKLPELLRQSAQLHADAVRQFLNFTLPGSAPLRRGARTDYSTSKVKVAV